jgi:hypothetical protein
MVCKGCEWVLVQLVKGQGPQAAMAKHVLPGGRAFAHLPGRCTGMRLLLCGGAAGNRLSSIAAIVSAGTVCVWHGWGHWLGWGRPGWIRQLCWLLSGPSSCRLLLLMESEEQKPGRDSALLGHAR